MKVVRSLCVLDHFWNRSSSCSAIDLMQLCSTISCSFVAYVKKRHFLSNHSECCFDHVISYCQYLLEKLFYEIIITAVIIRLFESIISLLSTFTSEIVLFFVNFS